MSAAPAPSPPSAAGAPVIALEHASFGYAEAPVVRDVTLTVAPGEVVALLGANGSGKSTLVRGLLGLSTHLGGHVRLFGVPVEDFDDHTRVGYVPQRHTLSASVRATVAEIVEVGRLPHRRWWKPGTGRRDGDLVDRCLEVVGLKDRAAADVSTLSGGQQRRVLIARALTSHPDVLVMDEPTAGVDVANQEVLAGVLARLAGDGTTMLIVTHELEALSDIVTRIVVMSGGRVSFDGTPAQFARVRRTLGAVGDDHHHPDESDEQASGLTGATPSGPLDQRGADHG